MLLTFSQKLPRRFRLGSKYASECSLSIRSEKPAKIWCGWLTSRSFIPSCDDFQDFSLSQDDEDENRFPILRINVRNNNCYCVHCVIKIFANIYCSLRLYFKKGYLRCFPWNLAKFLNSLFYRTHSLKPQLLLLRKRKFKLIVEEGLLM